MTGSSTSAISAETAEGSGTHHLSEKVALEERLRTAIQSAAALLPVQGPITVFVALNTLEAFEGMTFDEGVRTAGKLFGCEPYLPESRYRELYESGRIRIEDLSAVLKNDLGTQADECVLNLSSRFEIRLALLRHPLRLATGDELRWLMAESGALRTFREETPFSTKQRVILKTRQWVDQEIESGQSHTGEPENWDVRGVVSSILKELSSDSLERWSHADWEAFTLKLLWRVCRLGVHKVRHTVSGDKSPLRHRDVLFKAIGQDSDHLVHDFLIRFCAAYLDQGFAHWPLPDREQGFWAAFAGLYGSPGPEPDAWRAGLADELTAQSQAPFDPLRSIADSLQKWGVAESNWGEYLTATLLALKGWAGMINQVETRSDRAVRAIAPGSLYEFLAVRLILDRLAVAYLARKHLGFRGPLSQLAEVCRHVQHKPAQDPLDRRAFNVFQLAQILGWTPQELLKLDRTGWETLLRELSSFSNLSRRRVYHEAYERVYRIQVLDALHFRSRVEVKPVPTPEVQTVHCLDDREESLRRHLEEVAPETETFGVAGFFNIPMYYRGLADAHFVPLCPIVMRPANWVQEVVEECDQAHLRKTRKARKLFGHLSHQLHQLSRTFTGGAVIAGGLGALASFPLVARVLFPRLSAQLRSSTGLWTWPKDTRLMLHRSDREPPTKDHVLGFTMDELANCGARMLADIGLTTRFAPLVLIVGHTSTNLNNPHKSAYDCGACGGGGGGPNARAMAELLNLPDVREKLRQRGIAIPDETVFIGAVHNTCNDHVTIFDQDLVPMSHRDRLERFCRVIDEACARTAHERCRRFLSANLNASFQEAWKHVEGRSEDLAQARPEFGHSTVAMCVVGRRSRTRSLFMDHRAFLASYDPKQDDENYTVLSRILTPAVPVCVGIALQYFFSHIDSPGWGSGSKLPHNITSMIGVMDGTLSDLRSGLPWQGVEIHEPLRLLFVIETPFSSVPKLFANVPMLEKLTRNEWIQLAILDPDSEQIMVYDHGEFRPHEPENQLIPRAASSWEWYRGSRDPLPFALID